MPGLVLYENLPDRIGRILRGQGLDTVHVGALGFLATSDQSIWEFAVREDRVVLTKDFDYLDLAAMSGVGRVIILAVGNLRLNQLNVFIEDRAELIAEFVAGSERALVLGRDSTESDLGA